MCRPNFTLHPAIRPNFVTESLRQLFREMKTDSAHSEQLCANTPEMLPPQAGVLQTDIVYGNK